MYFITEHNKTLFRSPISIVLLMYFVTERNKTLFRSPIRIVLLRYFVTEYNTDVFPSSFHVYQLFIFLFSRMAPHKKKGGGKKGKGPGKGPTYPSLRVRSKSVPKKGKSKEGAKSPKKVVRRGERKKYSKEWAIRAAKGYIAGKWSSFRKAAAANGGIPEATVRDYHRMILAATDSDGTQYSEIHPKWVGKKTALDLDYERKLLDHCFECSDRGCGKSQG